MNRPPVVGVLLDRRAAQTQQNHTPAETMSRQLDRIENKLDILIAALNEEDDDGQIELTLDGHPAGTPRDQTLPL